MRLPAAILASTLALLCASCQPHSMGSSLSAQAVRQDWNFAGVPGQLLQTQHYNIYTTSGTRTLVDALPGFMENAHQNYLRLTGLGEARLPAMNVYVLGDRGQWATLTEAVTGPQREIYLSIQNGGYCFEGVCVFWDMSHMATYSVAAHEGLHQFLYHRLKAALPAWAEEGLATQAEGFAIAGNSVSFDPDRNNLRQVTLRNEIVSQRWIDLKDLLGTDAGEFIATHESRLSPEYYGQLWALLAFIRSDPVYSQGLRAMLADASAGKFRIPPPPGLRPKTIDYNRAMSLPLFQAYIDPDLSRFEARYKAFARKLAGL